VYKAEYLWCAVVVVAVVGCGGGDCGGGVVGGVVACVVVGGVVAGGVVGGGGVVVGGVLPTISCARPVLREEKQGRKKINEIHKNKHRAL
jgi:hypothetical protein